VKRHNRLDQLAQRHIDELVGHGVAERPSEVHPMRLQVGCGGQAAVIRRGGLPNPCWRLPLTSVAGAAGGCEGDRVVASLVGGPVEPNGAALPGFQSRVGYFLSRRCGYDALSSCKPRRRLLAHRPHLPDQGVTALSG